MKKLLITSIATAVAVGVVGVTALSASAMSGNSLGANEGQARVGSSAGYGQAGWLDGRAEALNMTAEQLQTALKTKTMSQVALDQGLSQADYQTKMNQIAERRWADRGLSAEEIAQRVADREARRAAMPDHEFGTGQGVGAYGYGHRQ